MSLVAVSKPLLRETLRRFRERHPAKRLWGVRAQGPWSGPERLELGDGAGAARVAWCPSSLAFREEMVRGSDGADLLVLLTDRTEQDLGDDVCARLPKRRLSLLDPWAAFESLHGIRNVSPRLRAREVAWLAEELLRVVDRPGEIEVEATGFLSESAAFRAWLEHGFGVPGGGRALPQVLEWVGSEAVETWRRASERDRDEVRRQLRDSVGAAAPAILRLVDADRVDDVLPLGLICRVVFVETGGEDGETTQLRREVAARLEDVTGRGEPFEEAGRAWADAAEERLRRLWEEAPERARDLVVRADRLLEELRGTALAEPSDHLESALGARREALGRALLAVLEELPEAASSVAASSVESGAAEALRRAEAAADRLKRHHRLGLESRRRERSAVEMSVRLLRWLAAGFASMSENGSEPAADLPSLAAAWAEEGSFADWARSELYLAHVESGAGGAVLAEAFRRILSRADARRERENEAWGRAVARWFAAPGEDRRLVPVESILDRVVAPLAARHPVLLVVIDGLSLPAFHELTSELQFEWMQIGQQLGEGEAGRWGLTPLPSVTAASRTSLWSGRLATGAQKNEARAFASHDALRRASKASKEPLLLHKSDLREEGSGDLSRQAREAITDESQRVVGAVINAVDDHLFKGEQVAVRWSLDSLQPLESLLSAARVAGRVVVLASDHGHVLDRGTESRKSHGGGERFRSAAVEPESGEVAVRGPRVLTEEGRIVVPWTESVRYGGARRNGYHGGATPQEMVVPLAVLAASWDDLPAGWSQVEGSLPSWWESRGGEVRTAAVARKGEEESETKTAKERARKAAKKTAKKTDTSQIDLFAARSPEDAAEDGATAEEAAPAHWIDRLLDESEVFAAQLAQVPGSERARQHLERLLRALDSHGGSLTLDALARRLNAPRVRLPSILAVGSRVLNVDGYEILEHDSAADVVRLDLGLLHTQFDLGGEE